MAECIMSDEMAEFDGDVDDALRERFENIAGLLRAGGMEAQSYESWCRSLADVLAEHPAERDLWIFAYGSLMWNPGIEVAEQRTALLRGFQRSFCLRDPAGRGSRDRPGLMLAIEPGTECRGIGLRIEAHHLRSELCTLWTREMVGRGYVAHWVQLQSELGPMRAIAFVANRESDRYAGGLSAGETAAILASARGLLGSGRNYLDNTAARLAALGIRDENIAALCERVHEIGERS